MAACDFSCSVEPDNLSALWASLQARRERATLLRQEMLEKRKAIQELRRLKERADNDLMLHVRPLLVASGHHPSQQPSQGLTVSLFSRMQEIRGHYDVAEADYEHLENRLDTEESLIEVCEIEFFNTLNATKTEPSYASTTSEDDDVWDFTYSKINLLGTDSDRLECLHPPYRSLLDAAGLGGPDDGLRTNKPTGLSVEGGTLDYEVEFEDAIGTLEDEVDAFEEVIIINQEYSRNRCGAALQELLWALRGVSQSPYDTFDPGRKPYSGWNGIGIAGFPDPGFGLDSLPRTIHGDGTHHHGHSGLLLALLGHSRSGSRRIPLGGGNGRRLPPLLVKLLCGFCVSWGLALPGVVAQHVVPDWLLHTVGGTSIAAGAAVPALRPDGDIPEVYRIAAYVAWAVAFVAFAALELYRRQDNRRLLLGMVAFCGANLLGSLAEDSSSTLDTVKNWGPLALAVSLYVVPVWIEFMGPRRAVELAAGV